MHAKYIYIFNLIEIRIQEKIISLKRGVLLGTKHNDGQWVTYATRCPKKKYYV